MGFRKARTSLGFGLSRQRTPACRVSSLLSSSLASVEPIKAAVLDVQCLPFGHYSHKVVLVNGGVWRASALGMLRVWGRRAKAPAVRTWGRGQWSEVSRGGAPHLKTHWFALPASPLMVPLWGQAGTPGTLAC